MMYFIIAIVFYLAYLAAGICFFMSVMGQKYRKERWYDLPLLLPVMPVFYIISWTVKK